MTTSHPHRILAALFWLPVALPAQDEVARPPTPSPDAILRNGLDRMGKLTSVAFRTTEIQNSAMTRAIARQVGHLVGGPAEVEVRGSWSDGILHARLHDDSDEIVSYRGRLIARSDDIPWKLRRDRLAAGGPLPFVLDPGRLFEALQALPAAALKVRHHLPSTYRDKAVAILGLTLEGRDAQDFALSGALPAVSAGMGGGIGRIVQLGGGGAAAPRLPELTVDLALYVEPATGDIHKIRCRCYQKSTNAANFQIQVQGGGGLGGNDGGDQEQDKAAERDADGKRIYKRGLPVRNLGDDLSRLDFDVVLTNHGTAPELQIDPAARKLLRLDR